MDDETIKAIVDEIIPLLNSRRPGKLFQLTAQSLAIDFRLPGSVYLLISVEPSQPRLYLIERRLRELEKMSLPPSPFLLLMKKELSGLSLETIEKDPADRIVHFVFAGHDELGLKRARKLVAQLTGRASNLFLVNENETVLASLRTTRGEGQSVGDKYHPPTVRARSERVISPTMSPSSPDSLSATLDAYYASLSVQQAFDAQAMAARARVKTDLTRAQKLIKKLQADLASHAAADQQKRLGDLLLANLSTAKRRGKRVRLHDYFEEGAPVIEIEIDESSTLQEEAKRRFAAYSRSKRAVGKIERRTIEVQSQIASLMARQKQLEEIIARQDQSALEGFTQTSPVPRTSAGGSKREPEKKIPGTRRYFSSDGYEILVGRAARDNDNLTFKVARPNDLWLHAADYPGSHVVVRNTTRKEIPHRTIIEAAQLAAYFSDARRDLKVAVRYTPRKFLAKPKGAAPGLVRMSQSRSITVEPKEAGERV